MEEVRGSIPLSSTEYPQVRRVGVTWVWLSPPTMTHNRVVRKRGYGSGSLRERRPGVWELRVAGRTRTVHGGRKVAERALAQFVTEVGSKRAPRGSETVAVLLDQWRATAQLAAETRTTYESALRHLPDEWLCRRLDGLAVRDFDRLYADLARAGVGAPMIQRLHVALSSGLTQAVRWQWLPYHPARGAKLPPIERHMVHPPSDTEIRALLDAAAATDLQTEVWIRLAIATGARRGELLALRWSSLDLARSVVRITASMLEDRTTKTTKTNRGRLVVLDEGTVELVARWQRAQAERAAACAVEIALDPWLLSNDPASSVPWRPDGATQRFARLCARAEVDGVRLHDLRHAHVSMLIAEGVDVLAIADRVGHARPTMTLNTYGHLIDGADRAAAAKVGRRLDGGQAAPRP